MTADMSYPALPARRRKRVRLATLRLVRESTFPAPDGYAAGPAGARTHRIPLHCPRDVFVLMQPYAEREIGESLWLLPLDAQHHLIGVGPTVITRGILNSSLVHSREVFCAAIVASAAAILLAHNHPSGDPAPSREDINVTNQLVAAGRILDIPVHDHVIIGHARFTSLAESGLI